jgi:hypothetical protein
MKAHDDNLESILTDIVSGTMKPIQSLFLNIAYENRLPIEVMCIV